MHPSEKPCDSYRKAMAWINGDHSQARTHICACVGPQDGAPVCPCRMGSLTVHNGRLVEIIDHGPVPKGAA
jgi:hypothetical protein